MTNTDNDSVRVEPPPVRPTLLPDLPGVTEGFGRGACSNGAGTSGQPLSADDWRWKNSRLRDRIHEILEAHPELRNAADKLTLHRGLYIEIGAPFLRASFLERIHGQLRERARAIIERRPDLEHFFDV